VATGKDIKVFWFFFSKKNILSFSFSPRASMKFRLGVFLCALLVQPHVTYGAGGSWCVFAGFVEATLICCVQQKGSTSFLKKRSKKLLCLEVRAGGKTATAIKSFLVLFLKKEHLAFPTNS
jgi:hypothetical protein